MKLKDREKYIAILDDAIAKVKDAQIKTKNRLEKNLPRIADSIISEWYDSYDRKSYDPYGSLYKMYKVTVTTSRYLVEFDSSFINGIKHHQSNNIIFNNSFELGYHGGSTGEGVPDNRPWWRSPAPFYPDWYKPAVKTFSPYDRIYKEMSKEIDSVKKENDILAEKLMKKLYPYIKKRNGRRRNG